MKCTQCKQDTTINDSIAPWVNELVCTKCIISGDTNSHSSTSNNNPTTDKRI